jgi:hypothetical protein
MPVDIHDHLFTLLGVLIAASASLWVAVITTRNKPMKKLGQELRSDHSRVSQVMFKIIERIGEVHCALEELHEKVDRHLEWHERQADEE